MKQPIGNHNDNSNNNEEKEAESGINWRLTTGEELQQLYQAGTIINPGR